MELYKTCEEIIKATLTDKIAFKDEYKKYSDSLSREDELILVRTCSLFYRNYYLINHLASILSFETNSFEFIKLGLLYINNAFLNIEDSNKMFNEFLTFVIQKGRTFTKEEITNINNVISKKRIYNFFDVKKGSVTYYSIRFNKPERLIKTILKQYGRNMGLGIVYEISSMPTQYFSIHKNVKIEDNDNYEKILPNLYRYKLDTSLRKEEDFHNDLIYSTQYAIHLAFESVKDLSNSKILGYFDEFNNLIYDFANKFGDNTNEIDIALNLKEGFRKELKILKNYKIKNLKTIYLSRKNNTNSIDESLYDFVLFSPKSSNIELFRKNPDYGTYLDPSDISKYISLSKSSLKRLNKLVKENGTLMVMIPTINLNETYNLVHDFISLDTSFEIEKERIFIPTKEENSLYYYCILKKTKK